MNEIPKAVLWVLEKLGEAGYEAYLVGGCVRDRLLCRSPQDYDVTTNASPDEVMRSFAKERVIPTGLAHGTVTVLHDGVPTEITTYRTESGYSDGRHPDSVLFTRDLSEDLCRRDFTVNAMAMDASGTIVDLYGGKNDLAAGLIRAVGDPEVRFTEDALRILRAFRFAAKLGFAIEEKTFAAAIRLAPRLSMVSRERIASEFCGLLCGRDAAAVLEKMAESGVLACIFDAPVPNADALRYMDALPLCAKVRFAALFSSDPNVGRHLASLKVSSAFSDRVCGILACTLPDKADLPSFRHAVSRFGKETVLDRAEINAAASGNDGVLCALRELLLRENCFSVSDLLINGADALAFGLRGKTVGGALSAVLDAVLDEKIPHTRDAELALLRTISEKD